MLKFTSSILGLFILFLMYVLASCQTHTSTALTDGKSIYKQYCTNCHGIEGSLKSNGAKDLRFSELTLEERILVIAHGRNIMTAFEGTLTPAQIQEVAHYTLSLKPQHDQ